MSRSTSISLNLKFSQQLILLRWISLFLAFGFTLYNLEQLQQIWSLFPLMSLFIVLLIFNLLNHLRAQRQQGLSHRSVVIQLTVDLLFFAFILYITGGGASAFASILLVPLALSALMCSRIVVAGHTFLAVFIYGYLVWQLSASKVHHSVHNETDHFQAMWLSFVISSVLLVFFIRRLESLLQKQLASNQTLLQQQYKNERTVQLAMQSALSLHQLSTPLNSIALATEVLQEKSPSPILSTIEQQVEKCKSILVEIRESAFDQSQAIDCDAFVQQLLTFWNLQFPEIKLSFAHSEQSQHMQQCSIISNRSLIAAIINLLHNAALHGDHSQLAIQARLQNQYLLLEFRNSAAQQSADDLRQLEVMPTDSPAGMGIGLFLANTTIEQFAGKVMLHFDDESNQVISQIILPLDNC